MKKHPIKYKLLLKMNNNRYENKRDKRDHYFSDLYKSTNCNL